MASSPGSTTHEGHGNALHWQQILKQPSKYRCLSLLLANFWFLMEFWLSHLNLQDRQQGPYQCQGRVQRHAAIHAPVKWDGKGSGFGGSGICRVTFLVRVSNHFGVTCAVLNPYCANMASYSDMRPLCPAAAHARGGIATCRQNTNTASHWLNKHRASLAEQTRCLIG